MVLVRQGKKNIPVRDILFLVALVGLLASSPTRKVQTAHGLFSPTIVSNRRFSSDRAKKISQCGIFYFWWPWSDSNRHSLQNLILSQARLPIPPRGQNRDFILQQIFWLLLFLPILHCVLPYVQAFSQAFLLFQLSFQSLS